MWGFYPTTIFRKFHVPLTHSSHTDSVSVYPPTTCENTKSCRRIFQIGWIQDPLLKSLTRSSLNSRSRSSSEIAFKILITRQDPHQGILPVKILGRVLAKVPCSPGPLKDRDPCPDPCRTPPLDPSFKILFRNRVRDAPPKSRSRSSSFVGILTARLDPSQDPCILNVSARTTKRAIIVTI